MAWAKGFPDLTVEIMEQVQKRFGDNKEKNQGDAYRRSIGIAPSYRKVEINIIDIIRIHDGNYAEHWGQSDFREVLNQIAG